MNRLVVCWVAILCCQEIVSQNLNGFDVSEALIPSENILRGGPPRDGIPSIDNPVFKPAEEYDELDHNLPVLGVYYNGVAKAYPIAILDWHEIVNDQFNEAPVVVTYCPLCGSGIAFNAKVKGKALIFGVSGLLYNSDVLLYDRSSESLWSQIQSQAISGTMKGELLEPLPTQRMSLRSWRKLHPETLVLTTKTGYTRNYQISPYGNYNQENRLFFPLSHEDDRLPKKEWVIGVEHNASYKAYPISSLVKIKARQLSDKLGGAELTLTWDQGGENVRIKTSTGEELVGLQMFWFAWAAFHPETLILTEGQKD